MYKLWVCRKCGHEVHAKDRPQPIRWTDGHVCYFYTVMENKVEEEAENVTRRSENNTRGTAGKN